MSETKPGDSQQDLFIDFQSGQPKKPERLPQLHRAPKPILLTTSVEQIILVGILMILAGCVIFFLGVLRGRSLDREAPGSRLGAAAVMPARPVAAPAAPAARIQAPKQVAVFQAAPAASPAVRIETRVPASADPTKPYTLQLITYKKRDLAETEAGELRRRGFQAFVVPSGAYFVVCSGQYGSKEEAVRDSQALGAKYKDAFLRRR
jgi:hypothetical protein